MSSRRKPPSWGKLPWGNIGTAPRQGQSAFGKLDWVRRTGHPPGSAPCSHPRVIDRSGEAALLGLAPCADHSLGHSLSMLFFDRHRDARTPLRKRKLCSFVVHQFSLYGGSDLSVSWWHCSWLSRFRYGSDL